MTDHFSPAYLALRWGGLYALWLVVFRLLILTFITYFVTSSTSRPAHFEEINESLSGSLLNLMGLGALGYILIWHWFTPLTSRVLQEIAPTWRLAKKFLPGLLDGAFLALTTLLAFLLSGHYRYLGFFIQLEEVPLAIGSIVLRTFSLGALVLCEEYLFRQRIQSVLTPYFRSRTEWRNRLGVALAVALFFTPIKFLQFDLGIMHTLTLFLVSATLSVRLAAGDDFARGAGFWAGILLVFHPLASLPVFGNDFSGILTLKHQTLADPASAGLFSDTIRFLTGGAGGPVASFAFQLLLIFDIIRNTLKSRSASMQQ